jgi:hypothetical protein
VVDAAVWVNTAPSASAVTVGLKLNASGQPYTLVVFAPVPGFSAMGFYSGDGLASGPSPALSFRPRWVLVRSTTTSKNWLVWDADRGVRSNPLTGATSGPLLLTTGFPDTTFVLDLLATGFKVRDALSSSNTLNERHVWLAFADAPAKYARAV